jgi:hypothetical protein
MVNARVGILFVTRSARLGHIARDHRRSIVAVPLMEPDEKEGNGRMLTRATTVIAALLATAFSAKAQDGDIAAGHDFAREAYRACHMVDREARVPRRINIGPAFRDIANTPGMAPSTWLTPGRLRRRIGVSSRVE